jgi:hypothetical protein
MSLLFVLLCVHTTFAQPDPSKVQEIRDKLGIPSDAKRVSLFETSHSTEVLIFGQTAHLDWDWLNYFSTNVDNQPPDVFPGTSCLDLG